MEVNWYLVEKLKISHIISVIGTKQRNHSYTSITPESSVNGAFDQTSVFNWGSFESDNQNPANFSDGTLSTFIHELSLNSGSNSTQCTWLNNGTVHNYIQLLKKTAGAVTKMPMSVI